MIIKAWMLFLFLLLQTTSIQANTAASALNADELNQLFNNLTSSSKSSLSTQMLRELNLEFQELEQTKSFLHHPHSWHKLDHQWAISKDREGDNIAIYDLSLRGPLQFTFGSRSYLGLAGATGISLRTYLEHVWAGLRNLRLNYVTKKALNILNRSASNDQTATSSIVKKYGQNWWKNIKWKNESLIKNNQQSLKNFSFMDIDLENMVLSKKTAKLQKLLNQIQEIKIDEENGDMDGMDIIAGISFENTETGELKIYFEHHDNSINAGSHPPKLVDMHDHYYGMKKAIKMRLLKELIKQVINLIQAPVLNQVLSIAVNRWFNLYDRMQEAHLIALIEALNQARVQADHTFNDFTQDEQITIFKSIFLSRISISNLWRRIRNTPHKIWEKQLADVTRNTATNLTKLKNKKFKLEFYSPWFALNTHNQQKIAFYSMGQKAKFNFFRSPVPMAVNYQNPYIENTRRKIVELIDMSLDFITPPFLFADKIIDLIFKWAVKNEIEDGLQWEARLSSNLKHREYTLGENWSYEIHLLNLRRLNPFELNRTQEKSLILARSKMLGI